MKKRKEEKREFLRVGEVASFLSVHPNTVRRWAETGFLPVAFRLGPRREMRFRRSDVERFLESQYQEASKEASKA